MLKLGPEDEAEVGALYRQLLTAWNQRNAADFAALFSEQGQVVGFDGSQMEGSREIQSALEQIFADHQTGRYVGKVKAVRFLSPEVAVLSAVAGVIPHGQTDINPDINSVQALVAARQGDGWRIALYQNTPAQFHGRPDLAQQLTDELRKSL